MTELKEKAMKIIEQIPEENMKYVLKKLGDMQEEFKAVDEKEELKKSKAAFEDLMSIINSHNIEVPENFDYKEEITKELWRKYESIA